jgi:hypothetical protein
MRLPTVLICLMMVSALGCGTPGAPLPPSLGIPKPVSDLHAVRKGDTVTVTWSTPTDTTDGALVRKPGKMQVARAISDNGAAGGAAQIVAELPLEPALKEPQPPAPTAKDSLERVLESGGEFATYTVVARSNLDKSAGPSNTAAVPLVPTLPAPAQVQATAVPLGVSLSWEQTRAPENRSHLIAQYAYRVMRREQGAPTPVMVKQIDFKQIDLGNEAITFVDTGIEWQKHYDYWITPVTLWQGAGKKGVVEGDDSPPAAIFADDKFPPEAPVGLQAVFSGLANQPFIDLTWTPNSEPDLAGYNVYRHSGDEPAVKISSELVKTPSFRDIQVKPGTKYFYAVSAVDLRGNESGRSAETSETAPPN